MTRQDYIDAVNTAPTSTASWMHVHESWIAMLAKAITRDDYHAVWHAWHDRWNRLGTESGSEYARGGPRYGSNWSGD